MHISFVLIDDLDFVFVFGDEISKSELEDGLSINILSLSIFLFLLFSFVLFASLFKAVFDHVNFMLMFVAFGLVIYLDANDRLFHFLDGGFLELYFLLSLLHLFGNFLDPFSQVFELLVFVFLLLQASMSLTFVNPFFVKS